MTLSTQLKTTDSDLKLVVLNIHACVLSHFGHVQLFVTLWIVARQVPLSMGFSSQEYWSGLLCLDPGCLPNPGTEPASLVSPALQVDSSLLRPNIHEAIVDKQASQVGAMVKNSPDNAGDTIDVSSIPGSGRCPREGNGTPLQYSCLRNSMDRRALQTIVYGVAKSWT